MRDILIILDFDHTLFNTTKLVQAEAEHFEHVFSISLEVFRQTREKVKICCVIEDIDHFVQLLPHSDKAALREALLSIIRTASPSCLFADVIPSLDILKGTADVLLATHGDSELQEAKIRSSGIPVEFPFAITQTKKSEIVAQYVHAYANIRVVDDKPDNLREIKERCPSVTTYLMRRTEDHPYTKSDVHYADCDEVISSLGDLLSEQT